MLRHSRSEIALAVGSSTLAGYVDAIGFLSLGGFFVSFMSGNSTRLAVGIASVTAEALVAASLIATFVVGVVAGSLIGRAAGNRRRPTVLGLVAITLAASALLSAFGAPHAAAMMAAAAMGIENATFERDGEVSIGLTYMTGTLVKLGQRVAIAVTGGSKTGWIPYALLWLGLVAGATAGATGFAYAGFAALWIASAWAVTLATIAWLAAL